MDRAADRFSANGIMNGAAVVMNTISGEIIAYVGNVNTTGAGAVDIVMANRSSGSLLKPFLYAAMLDTGTVLPGSLVSDIPTRIGSFGPQNMSRNYLGAVPSDEALARSLNIPAVRSLREFGVDRFARLLRSLGLTTIFRSGAEYGLPLILGGAEVKLLEITSLYAELARTAEALPGAAASVISPGAAWLTLEALCFTVRPGDEAHWQEFANARRIAWKTGTSYGFRDAWAIGVTPEWTVGVWIGNATGEGRAELRSAVTSAPVLFEIFSSLPTTPSSGNWFMQPAASLRDQEVCSFSGFPPGPDCFSFGNVLVPLNAPPHRPCPFCRTVTLNAERNRQVHIDASGSVPVVIENRFVLPPAEEWFYRRWNLDYRPLPSFDGRSAAGRSLLEHSVLTSPMALFNPQEGAQILVPRELDGREGRILFTAAHREPSARIHWHLDDTFLGTTMYFHEMEARPDGGRHTLTLVDESGNFLTRNFEALVR
jgi:penicillin-binding protein 1C